MLLLFLQNKIELRKKQQKKNFLLKFHLMVTLLGVHL